MKTDIIIVNWNSGSLLSSCVESVRQFNEGLVGSCVVIDNASIDGSADFLDGASDVTLIPSDRNLGFGRACNLGASTTNSDFLLLLNPDARLLSDSLKAPMMYLEREENASVGIVGVRLLDEQGSVQASCAYRPRPARLIAKSFGLTSIFPNWELLMDPRVHSSTQPVDQVMGAFFLIRRDLWDRLGGFDERFFVFFEEADLSARAASAGYSSVYLAEAQAYHKGGGTTENVKANRLFYSLRSRIQYALKHFSMPGALLTAFSAMVVEPFPRCVQLLAGARLTEVLDLFHAYVMLWRWVLCDRGRS